MSVLGFWSDFAWFGTGYKQGGGAVNNVKMRVGGVYESVSE